MAGPACPPDDHLLALAAGRIDAAPLDGLLAHVEVCPDCSERLRSLESHLAPLTALFEPALVELAFETEPEFQAVVTRLLDVESDRPPSRDLQPGHWLGQYQLLERIGSGGMGVVYRALHQKLSRHHAIKVLTPRLEDSPSARARFEEEIRLSAVFDHHRIVRVTDAGHADGHDYLVMELLDGIDLARLVRRLGPLPLADSCELIRQAAEGLEAAHRANIIHRDIKPSNLMLTAAGVKILDLGVSQAMRPLDLPSPTSPRQIVGTWDFMAPEQRDDARHANARSDLFSLGATLHFLLTGHPPRSSIAESLPEDLRSLLAALLAEDPAHRPSSARELITALALWTPGENVLQLLDDGRSGRLSERIPPTVPRPGKRSGSGGTTRPVWRWMGAVGLCGVSLVSVTLWYQTPTNPSNAESAANAEDSEVLVASQAADRAIAEWLVTRGGAVAFYRGNGPDGWVRSVESFPATPSLVQKLEWVPFGPELTDDDATRLLDLHALQGLSTNNASASPMVLTRLVQNRKLKWLYLPRTGASDEVLAAIAGLPELELLDLGETPVTTAGLRELARLPLLNWLRLAHTDLGDEAILPIKELTRLRYLDLTGTRVTDAGLTQLSVLKELHTLILDETEITDAALETLPTRPGWKKLSLHQTKTTPEGRDRLRSRCPQALVTP